MSGEEQIIYKKVFRCHRTAKLKAPRHSMRDRPSIVSKKDIHCRYELHKLKLANEPGIYYLEMHPHTGHDPAKNPEEHRWLKAAPLVEERVRQVCFQFLFLDLG